MTNQSNAVPAHRVELPRMGTFGSRSAPVGGGAI